MSVQVIYPKTSGARPLVEARINFRSFTQEVAVVEALKAALRMHAHASKQESRTCSERKSCRSAAKELRYTLRQLKGIG